MSHPIVVVGAGQAAASFASRHVAGGLHQPLLIIGEESTAPYQRPPLSKKYLLGEADLEQLYIRQPGWYEEQGVDTRFGIRVESVDRNASTVTLSDGEVINYDKLVLCTGSRPRTLPESAGGNLEGVYTLRTVDDIEKIRPEFTSGRHLLIVGGGYIGLEAAAVARTLGLEVTLVEMAERILQRVAARETSDFFRELHQSHGVTIRESAALERLSDEDGTFNGALLQSGETIVADIALVGIGALPNTDLAEAAGLDCDNGIAVDQQCRTSDSNIFAAGDCTSFVRNGQRIRLESVQNASDQGDLAARVIAGEDVSYTSIPWFWSEQYDTMLQIVGLNQGHDHTVLRPGAKESSQSIWYYRGDTLLAIDAMNDTKSYAFGRRLMEMGKPPTAKQAADPDVDLKVLLKS